MISNSTQNDTTMIVGTFAFTGTKTPKPLADAHASMTKLRKVSFGATRAGLGDAVAAAVLADRDPAADPDVHRAITANYLDNPGMTQHLEGLAVQGFLDACAGHHENIVSLWQEPYAKAAADLTASNTRLGGVDLDNTAAILSMGADAAEVWAQAQKEHRKVERIAQGWTALMTFMGVTLDRRYILLRTADVDARDWAERNLTGQHLSPWDALSAGLMLSLPTLTQYRERVAAIETAEAKAMAPAVDTLREGNKAWAGKMDAARAAEVSA